MQSGDVASVRLIFAYERQHGLSGCRYFGTEKPFMQTTVRSASSGFECTICAKPKLTVQRTLPFKTRAALLSSGAFILLAIRMRCDPSGETTQISFRSISEM